MKIRSILRTIGAALLGLAIFGPALACLEPQHRDFLKHASPDTNPKANPATGPENPAYNPE
ncbi:MAG: hypothetical protein P4L36_11690 [Holophaga sp.]|nr:hypothetical protein [Holophaga sp.]